MPARTIKLPLSPDRAKGPVRTCLGCGRKHLKESLLLFVAEQGGLLPVVGKRTLPGRGVYCCAEHRCLEGFAKKKGKILRGLRISKIDCSVVNSLVEEYRSKVTG